MSADASTGGATGAGGADGRRAAAIDPDVDLHLPADRAETAGGRAWPLLAATAVGGALGALARYGVQRLWPVPDPTAFPLGMALVNVSGCALIGVLMVLVSERATPPHPLVRPFLGVGVLGGFTSFSAYALDTYLLLRQGAVGMAVGYLTGTLLAALAAVWAATVATRALVRHRGGAQDRAAPGHGAGRP